MAPCSHKMQVLIYYASDFVNDRIRLHDHSSVCEIENCDMKSLKMFKQNGSTRLKLDKALIMHL